MIIQMGLFPALWSTMFLSITTVSTVCCSNETIDNFELKSSTTTVLSRRKRYLLFPDGSSFQLVFCTQNHGYLEVGNIVWFGNTAALAWELPTDPETFSMFKDHKRTYENRKHDSSKHILYVDHDGMVIGEIPYRRNTIVNPAFAKRSIREEFWKDDDTKKLSIKDMHDKEKTRNHIEALDETRLQFHRLTRMSLYGKIEKLWDGFGWNGRQCVLRLLCETSKTRAEQGTLLEEILRVTFRLPGGRRFDSVHEYDTAHGTDGGCAQLYPDCGNISTMQNY